MNKKFKALVVGIIVIAFCSNSKVYATDLIVSNAIELAKLKLQPGDRVILSGNSWKDQKLVFKGKGTAENPITLQGENSGKITLSGNSSLKIDGDWLIVDGLTFSQGTCEEGDVITFSKTSSHCRLTNTEISNYNSADKSKDYKWISVYGTYNRVDHCSLSGKTHQGTTLVVWLSENPNHAMIDHNYFGPRPDLGANGGETIRIGTSEWSMHDSYTKVEYNIFDKCNGETEIISIKSGHNSITNNLFYECVGTVTFRHGNNSNVSDNIFIGNKVKGTGGIRVIGENHNVTNNYLQGIAGTDYRAAISIMNALEEPKANEYFQVKNAVVKGNVIIDSKEAIAIGSGNDDKKVLPPENLTLVDNVIFNPTTLIKYYDVPVKSTIRDNYIKMGIKEDGFTAFKGDLKQNKARLWEVNGKAITPFWLTEAIGPAHLKLKFAEIIKY